MRTCPFTSGYKASGASHLHAACGGRPSSRWSPNQHRLSMVRRVKVGLEQSATFQTLRSRCSTVAFGTRLLGVHPGAFARSAFTGESAAPRAATGGCRRRSVQKIRGRRRVRKAGRQGRHGAIFAKTMLARQVVRVPCCALYGGSGTSPCRASISRERMAHPTRIRQVPFLLLAFTPGLRSDGVNQQLNGPALHCLPHTTTLDVTFVPQGKFIGPMRSSEPTPCTRVRPVCRKRCHAFTTPGVVEGPLKQSSATVKRSS